MIEVTRTSAPIIEISTDAIRLQGIPLPTKLLVRDVGDILGPPDRIVPGTPPAPPGHRNNEAYLYDTLGLYWLRQHDSEQVISLAVVFRQSSGPILVPFMPLLPFCGAIHLPRLIVTSTTFDVELRRALSSPNHQAIANIAGLYVGQFHISFLTDGNTGAAGIAGHGNLASVSIGLRSRSNRKL